MVVMTGNKLKQYRSELVPKVSQEKLARAANIGLATMRFAEWNRPIRYSTGKAILDALNRERQARNLPPLTLDDLELNLE